MPEAPTPDPLKLTRLLHKRETQASEARKALEVANAKIAELEKRPTTEALQKKVQQYQATERTRTHEAAFATEAKAAGVSETALKAAWKLAGLDTSADAPDPAALKTAVAQLLTDNPFLKGTDQPAPKTLEAGQGAGRGTGGGADLTGKYQVTEKQLADVAWKHAHDAEINKAADEGRLVIVS